MMYGEFELHAMIFKVKGNALRHELEDIVAGAAINADDTRNPAMTWREVFHYTLCSITTNRDTSNAARRWLARRGVRG
jgi:hypothetical protein